MAHMKAGKKSNPSKATRLNSSDGTDDRQAQLSSLRAKLKSNPKSAATHNQLLNAYLKIEDYASAMEVAKQFLTLHPDKKFAHHQFMAIANAVDADDYITWLKAVIKIAPKNVELLHQRALHFFKLKKYNAAFNDIRRACDLNPEREFKSTLSKAMTKVLTDSSRYHEIIEQLHQEFPKNASLFWMWTQVLSDTGQVKHFRKLVEDNWHWAKDKNPLYIALFHMQNVEGVDTKKSNLKGRKLYDAHLMANEFEDAIKAAPSELEIAFVEQALALMPPRYPAMKIADYTRDSIIAGPERPNGIVLAFGGLADKIGVPTHALDYFFADLGLTAIYLQDFSRHLYLKGVRHYGNSLVETLDALKAEIKTLGESKPLFTFANSGGGMAAMIYGAKLGAKASLVFSPPATFHPRDNKMFKEARAGIVRRRMERNMDHEEINLKRILTETTGEYIIHAYVGSGYQPDVLHAKMIEAMPRTDVHYMQDVETHTALLPATEKYGLRKLIKKHYSL